MFKFKKKIQGVAAPKEETPKSEPLKRVLATEIRRITGGGEPPHLEFPEQLFVKEHDEYQIYGVTRMLKGCVRLDDAVKCEGETEVAIYQLVRIKKFKKTSVESVTVEELPSGNQ